MITNPQQKSLVHSLFNVQRSPLKDFNQEYFKKSWFKHKNVLIFQDFVTGLSLSLYGSREEKMKWAFQLYDLDGDGCITREVNFSEKKLFCQVNIF